MADAYKVLYQGQIGNSAATLATAAGSYWIVKMMTAVNNDSSARTFGLYINGTAAANRITSGVVSLAASGGYWCWDGMSLTLTAGDTIAGIASVASQVTLTIYGDQVT